MIATTTREPVAPAVDQLARKRIQEILNRRPAVGLAVGVVRNGRLDFFHGHGLADITKRTPITEDTVFRIASISKTFTAIAVMQLCEQGEVDLDAPANDYLCAYKLVPAKPNFRPATLRHLLTHTSGIPEMVHPSRSLRYVFGESFELGEELPALGDYYRGALLLAWEPGTRFAYTDHGFATVGQIVEDVTGERLDRYFRKHIFEPLGMDDTDLLRSEHVRARLATGYNLGSAGARAVTDRQWLTAAASSVYSSPRDMARYMAALLGGGANDHGSILRPETLATMFEAQYRPDPRVPGIGLAFDRASLGGHLAIGHEGILPGFNSQFFVAPDDAVGVMAFTNGARQAMLWLPAETAGLLGVLLGVAEEVIRTDVPQHPEVWGDLCGRYPFSAPLTDTRARLMLGAGAQVFVRRGRLMIRLLSPIPAAYRGFVLHPDDENDPYVFRISLTEFGVDSARIVFSHTPDGEVTGVHLDIMPISLQKRPVASTTQPWVVGAAGGLAAAALAMVWRHRRRIE